MMGAAGNPVPRNVVIVGGGFTGACIAVQLVRLSPDPLNIRIVEARAHVGHGLAYSAVDTDHRLNAPAFIHSIIPDDAWHFLRWCQTHQVLERDPDAIRPDGSAYFRRADFGKYLEATVKAHADWVCTGSTITHVRDTAVRAQAASEGFEVTVASGQVLKADLLFVATGNPPPRLQPPLQPALASHPAVIENALDGARLNRIRGDARVLLVGSSLTALDALSTLVRQGHMGQVSVVSRRGLRPKPQGPLSPVLAKIQTPADLDALPGSMMMGLLLAPIPGFLQEVGEQPTLRDLVKALRARVRKFEAEGNTWYGAFDELRNCVWQLWPKLPSHEKRRFLKKMRPWYDVHRFRSPPQNDDMVRAAEAQGRIQFMAARLVSAAPSAAGHTIDVTLHKRGEATSQTESFDVLVNCTGIDVASGMAGNPFLMSLAHEGLIRQDACALGFEVDANGCAVGKDGSTHSALRVVGPPAMGTFGDPIGAMFIGGHIHRMMKDVLVPR